MLPFGTTSTLSDEAQADHAVRPTSFPYQPSAFEAHMRRHLRSEKGLPPGAALPVDELLAFAARVTERAQQLRQEPPRTARSARLLTAGAVSKRTMGADMSRKLFAFARKMHLRRGRVLTEDGDGGNATQSLQAPGLNSPPSNGDVNMTWYRWQSVSKPQVVDWSATSLATPVWNQLMCESCWALASTDLVSITSALAANQTAAAPLSPQHVCDCGAGQCCHGGWPEWAFQFILANGGLATSAEYPYAATDNSTCRNVAKAHLRARVTGWEKVPVRSNEALMKAVAQQPVLVYIASSSKDFAEYSGGIFNGNCSGDIDHAMVLVGYNTTDPDASYWLLKNTWGASWGESGYMRLAMLLDGNGQCNMMSESAVYPIYYEKKAKACNIVSPGPCGAGVCEVRYGTARCQCPPGFVERLESSAPKCVAATPCNANPNPCGVGTCNNQFDGSYTCSCPVGSVVGTRTDGAMTCAFGTFQSGLQTYTVISGDSCQTVADTFGLPVASLQEKNPFIECDVPLMPGFVLLVADASPSSSNFTWGCSAMDLVGPGDTCATVAARNGITARQLAAINPAINCSFDVSASNSSSSSSASSLPPPLPLSLPVCTSPGRLASGSPLIRTCGRTYDMAPTERCVEVARGFNLSLNDFLWLNPGLSCEDSAVGVPFTACVAPLSTQLVGVNCTQWYTVTQADTCFKIANAVQTPVGQFLKLNPGLRCYAPYFQIGQQVCVAGSITSVNRLTLSSAFVPYSVQENDTLTSIASQFKTRCSSSTSVKTMCETNSLPDCTDQAISPSQMLLIPCKNNVTADACADSLPVCGLDSVTYTSTCAAVQAFALPIVRDGPCNICNEGICYKRMGQRPAKNSCIAPPAICPYPTWKLPPDYFYYCPWMFSTQCECLQYTCKNMCQLSANTYKFNVFDKYASYSTASDFYKACYNTCYESNLRAGCA